MSNQNTYWTSLVKRILYLGLIVIGLIAGFKLSIFYMPFLIAFIISLIMEPGIKLLMKKTKLSRRVSSIIMFIITFGIIIGLLVWGIATIVSESTHLLTGFNEYYDKAYEQIQIIVNRFDLNKIKVPPEVLGVVEDTAFSMLQRISEIAQVFLNNLLKIVTGIPTFAIYFVVTILALYFICTDKIYILDELEHHLPEKWMKKLTIHLKNIIKSLGGYLKAQAILILISFIISVIGLYIINFSGMNIGYPLLIALGIGFVDALPILGSGTVMAPWAIISALNGNLQLGISIIVLWIIMSMVRQFMEPRIVSGNIGIHPIFTVAAMYTGFKLIGVIGMFVGPIVLIILKNIFSGFLDGGLVKTIFDME
ncbi:MAG: sporulation integral membrane protein YtvI [Clostridia bacterium]|nr:sporulation integral membrane protein YtvI [Clostridia bacterium]